MKHLGTTLVAAALAAFTAGPLAAQSDSGWWTPRVLDRDVAREVLDRAAERTRGPRADDERWDARNDDRRDRDDRWDDRRERRREGARRGNGRAAGGGPPFCRNGQGHPVHGWEWCERKGWGGGGYDVWTRQDGGWEDVILGGPDRPRRPSELPRGPSDIPRRMGEASLGTILGDAVMGRMLGHADRVGLGGSLDARWLDLGRRGGVLQVRAGGQPLAELADFDRDGRADVVLLRGGR